MGVHFLCTRTAIWIVSVHTEHDVHLVVIPKGPKGSTERGRMYLRPNNPIWRYQSTAGGWKGSAHLWLFRSHTGISKPTRGNWFGQESIKVLLAICSRVVPPGAHPVFPHLQCWKWFSPDTKWNMTTHPRKSTREISKIKTREGGGHGEKPITTSTAG